MFHIISLCVLDAQAIPIKKLNMNTVTFVLVDSTFVHTVGFSFCIWRWEFELGSRPLLHWIVLNLILLKTFFPHKLFAQMKSIPWIHSLFLLSAADDIIHNSAPLEIRRRLPTSIFRHFWWTEIWINGLRELKLGINFTLIIAGVESSFFFIVYVYIIDWSCAFLATKFDHFTSIYARYNFIYPVAYSTIICTA